MSDVAVTEISELEATKVSGVGTPANGIPFILVKAAAEECSTCKGKGTIMEGNRKCPDCEGAAKSDSAEADEQEDEMTKEEDTPDTKKGAVQDGLNGTDEPSAAGHLDSGNSGVSGSVTAGMRDQPTDSSLFPGGRSTVEIPIESKVHDNPHAPVPDGAGIIEPQAMAKAVAVSSLWDALDQIEQNRQAIKDGTFTQASGDAALVPGSMPWESFDAATLKQVAECLAGCCSALDYMAQREREESMSADPSDIENAWDLEEAGRALDYAMGVAARLSFHEAAEGVAAKSAEESAAKVGRKLSGKNTSALTAARDHLNEVLAGAGGKDDNSSEEDTIQMEMTKEELGELIVKSIKAVKDHEDAEAKKAADEAAEKNANNGGDISEADIKPTSVHDADDVKSVGGQAKPEYVNKGEQEDSEDGKGVSKSGDGEPETDGALLKTMLARLDGLDGLAKELESVKETVGKIAKRARPVGPSLDGQARVLPDEGRLSAAVKTGVTDDSIAEKETMFEAETDPVKKAQIGEELTHARLVQHFAGQQRGALTV